MFGPGLPWFLSLGVVYGRDPDDLTLLGVEIWPRKGPAWLEILDHFPSMEQNFAKLSLGPARNLHLRALFQGLMNMHNTAPPHFFSRQYAFRIPAVLTDHSGTVYHLAERNPTQKRGVKGIAVSRATLAMGNQSKGRPLGSGWRREGQGRECRSGSGSRGEMGAAPRVPQGNRLTASGAYMAENIRGAGEDGLRDEFPGESLVSYADSRNSGKFGETKGEFRARRRLLCSNTALVDLSTGPSRLRCFPLQRALALEVFGSVHRCGRRFLTNACTPT